MKHVLCVGEDQPLWREIRTQPLSFSRQWIARFAQTGPEALKCAQSGHFAEQTVPLPLQLDQPYLEELGLLERAEFWRRHCQDLNVQAAY